MASTSAAKITMEFNGHIELKTNAKSNIDAAAAAAGWCCCCEIAPNRHTEPCADECETEIKLSTAVEWKSSNVSCATVAQLRNVKQIHWTLLSFSQLANNIFMRFRILCMGDGKCDSDNDDDDIVHTTLSLSCSHSISACEWECCERMRVNFEGKPCRLWVIDWWRYMYKCQKARYDCVRVCVNVYAFYLCSHERDDYMIESKRQTKRMWKRIHRASLALHEA